MPVSLYRNLILMKKRLAIFSFFLAVALFTGSQLQAQCSICTKTASQLGEKPAQGLNSGILYLMFTPLAIAGFIGYRWWQREKLVIQEENN